MLYSVNITLDPHIDFFTTRVFGKKMVLKSFVRQTFNTLTLESRNTLSFYVASEKPQADIVNKMSSFFRFNKDYNANISITSNDKNIIDLIVRNSTCQTIFFNAYN